MPAQVDPSLMNAAQFAAEIYKRNVELLDQRRRVEKLLYEVSEAIIAIDPDYNITIFNRAAEKLLNKKSTDVTGKNLCNFLFLEYDKGPPINLKDILFSDDPSKNELNALVLKSDLKNYYVNLKSAIITKESGPSECLITLTDITTEKELEKTKDDFISVTSHELRTPMTIIKSYLWMLGNEKKGILNDKQKEYLEKAQRGAERMLNLINDTLSISRIEQGRIEFKIEPVDLKETISEICADFVIKAEEKNIYLKTEYDAQLDAEKIIVSADKTKLREVIINYLGNSIKFTKTGGITIKIQALVNNTLMISIIDTGRGIEANDMEKLFHKFGRIDNSYETVAESGGTGLGLYIVKSLVEKMGGTVGAHSDGIGTGSTFWFTLKRTQIS